MLCLCLLGLAEGRATPPNSVVRRGWWGLGYRQPQSLSSSVALCWKCVRVIAFYEILSVLEGWVTRPRTDKTQSM